MTPTFDEISDWMENGLGRVIEFTDESLSVSWRGFVDQINVRLSGLEVSIGPLTGIANRGVLEYSSFDTGTSPPTVGVRKTTAVENNTDSQSKYGISYKVFSSAGVTDAESTQLLSMLLASRAWPETTTNFSFDNAAFKMSLSCRGFMGLMNFPYNQTDYSGQENLSAKITDILAAEPNGYFTDLSHVTANTFQVIRYKNSNNIADGLLKGLMAYGDATLTRYGMGFYEDNALVYAPVSEQVDYTMPISSSSQHIFSISGDEVPLSQIRPGKWVFFNDFLPGYLPINDSLNQDPRMLFVESVTFRSPRSIILNGGKTSKVDQN